MSENGSTRRRRDFFKLAGGAFGIAAISYFLGLRERVRPAPSDLLPDYVDDGSGFPIFRPPYLQKDVELAAFMFPADIPALSTLCDQTLNSPESFPYKYVPVIPNVLLVYADMLVSSLDERDARLGQIPETEVSFWALTLAMQKVSNDFVPHHLAWFVPYLFVDEGNSISTGREVYGFNKQAGIFTKPADIQNPQFTADVIGIRKFGPDSIAQNERLLELNLLQSGSPTAAWADVDSARIAMSNEIAGNIRPDWEDSVVRFVTGALTKNIPLVFLKQFRHAGAALKAGYRSIVEAPLRVKEFREGGSFQHKQVLKIDELDSHPIKHRLGLADEQESTFGAWMKLDFVLETGIEYV